MASRRVSVWYDGEEDMFETLWAFREAYFTPSDDARILKRLDHDGQVIGFSHPRDMHLQTVKPGRVRSRLRDP